MTRLRRVLEHERSQDYANKLVIGGLDAMLTAFSTQIDWLNSVPPRRSQSYASLGQGDRQIWIEHVLSKLASMSIPPGVAQRANRAAQRTDQASRPVSPSQERGTSKPVKPRRRPAASSKPPAKVTLEGSIADIDITTKANVGKLAKIGVNTLRDMLWHFPIRHIDYSKPTRIYDLELGQETTIVGHVVRAEKLSISRNGAARVMVSDGTGLLSVTFFGQPYLAAQLKPGTNIAISGKVGEYRGQAQMESPEHEVLGRGRDMTYAGNLLPVYPSTEKLQQRAIRTASRKALDLGLPLLNDMLPVEIVKRRQMPALREAVSDMHYPKAAPDVERGRRRLAFDELMLNQLLVARSRADWRSRGRGFALASASERLAEFMQSLEFELTTDQRQTLDTMLSDMSSGVPMARLLQGEVGSGKTIIALASILACVANGYRGAFLAPTEVLAEQHFLSTSRQLSAESTPLMPPTIRQAIAPGLRDTPVAVGLLTGSLSASQKAKMHELIAAGQIDIIIGTHALLQDAVEIPGLALAVVDEQHRFGVEQRAALAQREPRPHMLAMSATPIPRTLALTVYGDLEVSTLKTMPRGRSPLKTIWARDSHARKDAYNWIRAQVSQGRQAFIVCPLIDESEVIEARAAIPEFERLNSGPLSDLRLGLLHGRMPLAEKQEAMEKFRSREIDVLVATPVIEVGVDVPNATVMMIESADRFGLAQLHQLRGRVGRGGHAGTCFLLSDKPSADSIDRLRIVEATSDGFELAEHDLRVRGPGEYTGTQQSGWAQMKVATPGDLDLIEVCRDEAGKLLSEDPTLSLKKHSALRKELEIFSEGRPAELS